MVKFDANTMKMMFVQNEFNFFRFLKSEIPQCSRNVKFNIEKQYLFYNLLLVQFDW